MMQEEGLRLSYDKSLKAAMVSRMKSPDEVTQYTVPASLRGMKIDTLTAADIQSVKKKVGARVDMNKVAQVAVIDKVIQAKEIWYMVAPGNVRGHKLNRTKKLGLQQNEIMNAVQRFEDVVIEDDIVYIRKQFEDYTTVAVGYSFLHSGARQDDTILLDILSQNYNQKRLF